MIRYSKPLTRRMMLQNCATSCSTILALRPWAMSRDSAVEVQQANAISQNLLDRAHGLLLGSCIGDALGGPTEFQPLVEAQKLRGGPKAWGDDEVMDTVARKAAAERLQLLPYAPLRPVPEPYGHWQAHAAAGTVTDDSRQKFILLHALVAARKANTALTVERFAQAYLDWPNQALLEQHPHYEVLNKTWLAEYHQAARWVLGERDFRLAKPPDRLWSGWPTCAGQMALLPLAILYPGQTEAAYLAAYEIDFIDVGWGKDLNCGLVAALAAALTMQVDESNRAEVWESIRNVLRHIDPYEYNQIPWTQRAADRWLTLASRLVKESDGRPAHLFAGLSRVFSETTKWHAEVPLVVMFACLEIADYDPLAAWQLTIEWGEDTDSFAQLLGAFLGALYGAQYFSEALRKPVEERLDADYSQDLLYWSRFLASR